MDLRHDLLPDLLPGLLPDSVSVVEAYLDLPDDLATVSTYADEFTAVDRAIRSRQQEFATARQCARAALAKLGYPPVAIPRGPRGAPIWPAGIVGSITHCAGFRAAAVARSTDIVALGIDAEPNEPLPGGVLDVVTLPRERMLINRLAATVGSLRDSEPSDGAPNDGGPSDGGQVCWDRLVFSAKESVYKVWYPLAGTFLDFVDAELDIDPATRTFSAHLLVEAPIVDGRAWQDISGRYTVGRGYVVTAVSRVAGADARRDETP